MTDEQALAKFIEFLETRVSISTEFIQEVEGGNLTHQFLRLRCGEEELVSSPQPLKTQLRFATAEESGASVN